MATFAFNTDVLRMFYLSELYHMEKICVCFVHESSVFACKFLSLDREKQREP